MRTLTKQKMIDMVVGRWYESYHENQNWNEDFSLVYQRLVDLKNPTEDQITEVIGNSSWTRLECNFCQKNVNEVVIQNVYDKPVYICRNCLELARQLLDKTK